LGWSLERYLKSSIYEFNEASKGYWRKWEQQVWQTREILWQMIQGNPHIKAEDKPKVKSEIYKLSSDEVKKVKKRVPKVTEEDLFFYQQIGFNKQ